MPELFPDEGDYLAVEVLLKAQGAPPAGPFIAIAPGSVWPTKRWLPERFGRVADHLIQENFRVVFIGSSMDRGLCESIVSGMHHRPIVAAGHWSLRQSAAFLSRCRVLLSNDSAPVHMGVAMGTRVVALFGPTVPAFGFAPYGEDHAVIQRNVSCRPCSVHGGKRCPQGHFRCMKEISVEEVLHVLLGGNG
jgi:heptosyltransferase-2